MSDTIQTHEKELASLLNVHESYVKLQNGYYSVPLFNYMDRTDILKARAFGFLLSHISRVINNGNTIIDVLVYFDYLGDGQ